MRWKGRHQEMQKARKSKIYRRIDNDASIFNKEKDRLDRKAEGALNDAIRYTDSRIDKLSSKK